MSTQPISAFEETSVRYDTSTLTTATQDLSERHPSLEVPHRTWLEIYYTSHGACLKNYAEKYHNMSNPTKPEDGSNLNGCRFPDSIGREECFYPNDIQGIEWSNIKHPESVRRSRRDLLREARPRETWQIFRSGNQSIRPETFFQHSRTWKTSLFIRHEQLRHLVSAVSKNDIFYVDQFCVKHLDPSNGTDSTPINLEHDTKSHGRPRGVHPTCIATHDSALVAGTFTGEYALLNLSSDLGTPPTTGIIAHGPQNKIYTNHVDAYRSASGCTEAAFSSNDGGLRILDCTTNIFSNHFPHAQPVNCSAISPTGQLRIVAGDEFQGLLVTDAKRGRILEHIPRPANDNSRLQPRHFAKTLCCAFADDGRTVATGSEDNRVVIHDARQWNIPLQILDTKESAPLSLRFSPTGGGKRVLVAAEADDYVSVFGGANWDGEQVLEFYGSCGGVDFEPQGRGLYVGICDPYFGGVVEYEQGVGRGVMEYEPWGGKGEGVFGKGSRKRKVAALFEEEVDCDDGG